MKRKILFISHDGSLTGAPRECYLIVKHLDRTGFEPHVLLGKDGPLRPYFERVASVSVQPLFGRGLKYFREFEFAFRRYNFLSTLKPDLVFCNTIMTSKWLFYSQTLKIPTILHVHELSDVFRNLSYSDRFILRRMADHYIAASSAVHQYLVVAEKIKPDTITTFRECIEVNQISRHRKDTLRASLFPNNPDLIIGTVGRVAHVKGIDIFIDAAKRLKDRGENYQKVGFLVVGGPTESDGKYYQNLLSTIKLHGLEGDVVITGSRENVLDYFSLIDIFVLPSREDPFPLVTLEAMALSLPVIAFNVGGSREALGEDSGIILDTIDDRLLSETMASLVANPVLRRTLGNNGRRRVLEFFDIQKNIGEIEKVILRFSR